MSAKKVEVVQSVINVLLVIINFQIVSNANVMMLVQLVNHVTKQLVNVIAKQISIIKSVLSARRTFSIIHFVKVK